MFKAVRFSTSFPLYIGHFSRGRGRCQTLKNTMCIKVDDILQNKGSVDAHRMRKSDKLKACFTCQLAFFWGVGVGAFRQKNEHLSRFVCQIGTEDPVSDSNSCLKNNPPDATVLCNTLQKIHFVCYSYWSDSTRRMRNRI